MNLFELFVTACVVFIILCAVIPVVQLSVKSSREAAKEREKQAQAAAGSLHAGGEARLMLTETGAGSFRPAWIVTVEGRSLWTQDG